MKVQYGLSFLVGLVLKGTLVCKGDLLKPLVSTPAKHSRGNIFDGSDKWNYYGPNYL